MAKPTPIDLTKARPGDRFERRDGVTMEFVGSSHGWNTKIYPFLLVNIVNKAEVNYTSRGTILDKGKDPLDLIRALPREPQKKPKPAPKVKRVRVWYYFENGLHNIFDSRSVARFSHGITKNKKKSPIVSTWTDLPVPAKGKKS